jgi:hypothetical protein
MCYSPNPQWEQRICRRPTVKDGVSLPVFYSDANPQILSPPVGLGNHCRVITHRRNDSIHVAFHDLVEVKSAAYLGRDL